MSKTIKILIGPDGTFKHIYNEALLPLDKALGEVNIQRASHVEFNNDTQRWEVEVDGEKLPMTFPKRQDALDYEVVWLEENRLHE
jgi:hypothetical protein